jgi:hypothetical protein
VYYLKQDSTLVAAALRATSAGSLGTRVSQLPNDDFADSGDVAMTAPPQPPQATHAGHTVSSVTGQDQDQGQNNRLLIRRAKHC